MIATWSLRAGRSVLGAFRRQTSGRGYIPELDGLRFISILLVMVWHASLRAARYYGIAGPADGQSWYAWFPHGEIGVLMFFIISGFVVSLPFLRKAEGRTGIRNFFARRLVRIYPPYVLTLAIAFVFLGLIGFVPQNANSYQANGISLNQSFFASLFYLHGLLYNAPSRLNPPMWSLELEIAFYALIPFFMLAYRRIQTKSHRCALLVAAIVMSIAIASFALGADTEGYRFRAGPWHYGYYFLAGVLLAEFADALNQRSGKSYLFDCVAIVGWALLWASGLVMTQIDAVVPPGLVWFAFKLGLLGSLVLSFICAFRGRLSSYVLSLPSVGAIGVFCYSVYLTHVPVMQACSEVLSRVFHLASPWQIWPIWIAVSLLASILCGAAFYLAVERPFALAASRLGRPRPILSDTGHPAERMPTFALKALRR